MKIVSVGAGNLAYHLLKALQNAGFELIQVYSRTEASAKELAERLNVPYTIDICSINCNASVYVIAVNDDAIDKISDSFISNKGLFIHTAGSVPMNVFKGKLKNYGVIYPLQTFSKLRSVNFANIPIFIEANTEENLQLLRTIADVISSKVFHASSEERKQLHLAAVFGCNFVNHLYNVSAQLAKQAGFDFSVLFPLILETANKVLVSGNPKEVQTGPAIRNDRIVMQKHLELLSRKPEWKEIYAVLSENIKRMKNEV